MINFRQKIFFTDLVKNTWEKTKKDPHLIISAASLGLSGTKFVSDKIKEKKERADRKRQIEATENLIQSLDSLKTSLPTKPRYKLKRDDSI